MVWYGKLKIDAKAIPVIYDPLLTSGIKGCIYLYHSQRDEIVQYTWKIVQKLLVDVDTAEKASIKKALDAKAKLARKKFTKGQEYNLTSGQKEAIPAPPTETSDLRWEAPADDNFELEDLD